MIQLLCSKCKMSMVWLLTFEPEVIIVKKITSHFSVHQSPVWMTICCWCSALYVLPPIIFYHQISFRKRGRNKVSFLEQNYIPSFLMSTLHGVFTTYSICMALYNITENLKYGRSFISSNLPKSFDIFILFHLLINLLRWGYWRNQVGFNIKRKYGTMEPYLCEEIWLDLSS